MSASIFVSRLMQLADLREADVEVIQRLPWFSSDVRRGRDIVAAGERPDYVYVVESGWAARYSLRSDGSRRITGFMLPGDFCGIHAVVDVAMEHAIVALTNCQIARIRKPMIDAAVAASPVFGQALWHAKLIDEAILRVWLLNSHDAEKAIAHLLCELHVRLEFTHGEHIATFEAPLTQEHLADALGLTPVHVNRMLRKLAEAGLIEYEHRVYSIPNIENLRRHCSFSLHYLHQSHLTSRAA